MHGELISYEVVVDWIIYNHWVFDDLYSEKKIFCIVCVIKVNNIEYISLKKSRKQEGVAGVNQGSWLPQVNQIPILTIC